MLNIPFFDNVKLDLYSYNTESSFDEYGETTESYIFRETVTADMQAYSPQSSLREFGKILQDTYRVYLSKDVEVYDTDQIRLGDKKFEIMGSVEDWNHILPYRKITVKLQRKEGV